MGKKVLITGAAGFLGRYAARHFAGLGWDVLGVDILPPENAPLASLGRYTQLVLPDPALSELLRHEQPDVCIHCAGRASVSHSVSDPAPDFHAGTVLTFEILNSLRLNAPGCCFILISSAAVYGNPISLPVTESQSPAPLSPYGYHKWQAEMLCQEYSKVYNLKTVSVRIFSAYGPGLRRQVIWDICQKILTGQVLVLQGTGRESRDFIHALDIARALECLTIHAPAQGEVYNLACGREVLIADLAKMILDALGSSFPVNFDGVIPTGTPLRWQADISKIEALGFHPGIRLEDGIKSFSDWCRAELSVLS